MNINISHGAENRDENAAPGQPEPTPHPLDPWLDRILSLGLAGRSTFWTIVLGAVMAGSISLYMHFGAVDILTRHATENLASAVETSAERFSSSLSRLMHDLTFLSDTPPLHGIVDGNAYWRDRVQVTDNFWRDRLAEILSALVAARPQYVQARLIGIADGGREIVRVDRTPDGGVRRVAGDRLQRKGDRPYFQHAIGVGHDEIYISDIELNQEHGRIQEPHLPVLRMARPVFDVAGNLFGIVVLNVDATWLFDQITGNRTGNGGGRRAWYVANADGDYLLAPDSARTFGFDLGARFRMQEDFPELAGIFTAGGVKYSGFIGSETHSHLAAARRIALHPGQEERYLVIASLEPVDALLGEINRQRRDIFVIASLLIIAGSVFAVAMAQAVARPLRRMSSAASALAMGQRDVELGDLMERRDEAGELAKAFAQMAKEITEREKRLMAQARELTRSNQELAQFAYVASHDLQEPLRMVGSYLELLEHRAGESLDSDAREFIAYAVDGAARMKQLINDLLDYSRAGSREIRRRPVDLAGVVGHAVQVLEKQLKQHDAVVEVGDLPVIQADEIQIERVFLNLIENAVKYRSQASPHIRIGSQRVGQSWRVWVADNGIGIEPRFTGKIFEIFRRLHGREEYSGTGIGLAVVKLVVERHGGTVAVDSEPGRGSTFIVTLPDQGGNHHA